MSEAATRFDIAILGCGPIGALLANQLGAQGRSVAVIEKETAIYPLPRAVHFDGEVMRIFQNAGLADAVERIARPSSKGMHFISHTGKTLLIRRAIEGPGPHDWAGNYYVHQPFLEEALRAGMARYPNVRFLSGHEVTDIVTEPAGARLACIDHGSGAAREIRARYVVGCDGARSLVRRLVSRAMEDLGLHQPWLVVDVLVDLNSERVRALKDYSIQHCDPARPMTLVYVGGSRRRWEIMLMPGDDPERMTRPETIWSLLAPWLKPEDGTLERAALYTFHSLIARGWREGPLLLAGDACHQTPPFLGQGMCAGMRDAANLAWKFDLVFRGLAAESLLDSYESERRPHVHAFIKLAVDLGAIIQATDPARAEARDRSFQDGAPAMFDFPQPQLGPGIRLEGAAPVGQIFPQPRLDDGRRLDQVIGGRFALVGTPDFIAGIGAALEAELAHRHVALVRAPSAAMARWFAEQRTAGALLRPDAYIFATFGAPAELAGALAALAQHLLPVREPAVRSA